MGNQQSGAGSDGSGKKNDKGSTAFINYQLNLHFVKDIFKE